MKLKSFENFVNEKKSNPVYLGAFLDKKNQSKLLNKFPALYPNVFADHVTLKFGSMKGWEKLGYKIGETISFEVVGYLTSNGVQAVKVDSINSTNKMPHITISTEEGVNPVKSNQELQNNTKNIEKVSLKLEAKIGFWYNGGKISYDE